jgi:molybdate transport system regulatory protein
MSRRQGGSKIKVKFWLEDAEGKAFFGKGMVNLLRAIDTYKSISVACARIGMSYRYALHRITIAEQRSGRKLVDRFKGGRTKGGAQLTQQGRFLLERYLLAERVLEQFVKTM